MIKRSIALDCSPEEAFAAFTEAEEIKRWWGDATSYRTIEWHGEPKLGSKWHALFVSADGQSFRATGAYTTVERPAALDWTWAADWSPGGIKQIKTRFEPATHGTHMVVTSDGYANEEEQAADKRGWDQILGWFFHHMASDRG